jgi:predicted permease
MCAGVATIYCVNRRSHRQSDSDVRISRQRLLMQPLWSQAAVILSAMPTAANAYVIAQQYNVHFKIVSAAIVVC